jgi:hypothetical protein
MHSDPRYVRVRRALAAGLAVLCATACEKGGAGTYQLKTADRSPLPIALAADSVCLVQLMGGKVVLKQGGFTMDYIIRRVCPTGSTPLADPGGSGKFDLDQGVITFRDSLGRRLDRGEIRGDTLIVSGKQHTLRFVK